MIRKYFPLLPEAIKFENNSYFAQLFEEKSHTIYSQRKFSYKSNAEDHISIPFLVFEVTDSLCCYIIVWLKEIIKVYIRDGSRFSRKGGVSEN